MRIYYQNSWLAVIRSILAALDGSKSVWSGIAKHASNKLSVTMQNLECRNLTLLVVACCGLAPVLLTSPEFILNRVSALKVLHFTPCLYFHATKSGRVPAVSHCQLLQCSKIFFIYCWRHSIIAKAIMEEKVGSGKKVSLNSGMWGEWDVDSNL